MSGSALRRHLIVAVVLAVIAEVVLLRLALRLGPVLPTGVNLLPLFAVVERVGVIALNVSVLAAAALLSLAAVEAVRAGPARWLLALALVSALVVNLGLPLLAATLPSDGLTSLHALLTGCGVVLIVGTFAPRALVGWSVVLAGAAQMMALVPAADAVWMTGHGLPPSALSETFAVLAALLLPWASHVRPSRTEVVAGLTVGGLLTLTASLQPWGLATVAIWTLGFSLFLPPLAYGAALASVVMTMLAARRLGWSADVLVGLTLLALAGLKLDVSSSALVSLAGLLLAIQTPRPATLLVAAHPAVPTLAVAGNGGRA